MFITYIVVTLTLVNATRLWSYVQLSSSGPWPRPFKFSCHKICINCTHTHTHTLTHTHIVMKTIYQSTHVFLTLKVSLIKFLMIKQDFVGMRIRNTPSNKIMIFSRHSQSLAKSANTHIFLKKSFRHIHDHNKQYPHKSLWFVNWNKIKCMVPRYLLRLPWPPPTPFWVCFTQFSHLVIFNEG